MEPVRNTNVTLVDLLDRILDKGLVIYADVIVSVAGVPLIGINLRTALAGMEAMLEYGVMKEWDEKSRAWERERREKEEVSLIEKRKIIINKRAQDIEKENCSEKEENKSLGVL
ncbi:MAG: gas vesicle protein [candidate division Zixibacteria bacterium]|nr:gas vesicle protein [candidate division Zixibacteria bacterium]